MNDRSREVTTLLDDVARGDPDAMRKLLPLVYDDLRARAGAYMRGERKGHTLQPTALVNEAYMRLVDQQDVPWSGRGHFLAIASKTMRRILIEHARARGARKRQGDWGRIPLNEGVLEGRAEVDILEIDEALERLAKHDERLARVVELRFFGGLSVEETAGALGVDPRTVKRDWRAARALLFDLLG